MFCKKLISNVYFYSKYAQYNVSLLRRTYQKSAFNFAQDKKKDEKQQASEIMVKTTFENMEVKNRNTYLDMVQLYIDHDVHRRGHVEFIYSALKNMEQFNVNKDLDVYKALIDVLPKGKFIPTNLIQSEFMHYPKQQQCAIDLLEQMEDNGVMPDGEMEDMLLNVFGKRGYPLRKYWRMMYWMPKFKNASPWPVPNPPPNDALELAKLAISRISSADIQANQTIYQTSDIADSIDDTWIVSSQSPTQQKLLAEHQTDQPIYIEGSFRVWLRTQCVNYFILRGNPRPIDTSIEDSDDVSKIKVSLFNFPSEPKTLVKVPSVHEQSDGVIYSLCATGTSSKDSLLSWIRHLEKENPVLQSCPIVFTLRTAEKEVAVVTEPEKLEDK